MYHPKISIITVVYNRVGTIEQLISSVVNQTYDNIEFIIVDGASTDGTVDIIKKYDSVITNWISEPDDGIYNAMNKAVSMATGDYIEIIGSDDALAGEHAIESIIPYFDDETDLLSCNEWKVYPTVKRQSLLDNKYARDFDAYQGGMVGHAALFTRREVFKKYRFDESYKIAADYKFFLECYFDKEIKIKFVDNCIVYFESDAIGLSANKQACLQENARIYNELNLPFDDIERMKKGRSFIKNFLITTLDILHIGDKAREFKKLYISSQKHHCSNKICRWCGRR